MINVPKHREIILSILKELYQNSTISPSLGFKGGTALYIFHQLPRFSVDLDFNLLVEEQHLKSEIITEILQKYIEIKDTTKKYHTYFWLGSYEETQRNVKIEISRSDYPDEYELLDFLGLSVTCMKKPYLFAHKLCAIHNRSGLVSRDLFDAHFMFEQHFSIAENIIEIRTNMNVKNYFKKLIKYIPKHVTPKNILQGLGELLDEKQKQWVKEHLVEELLFYLRAYSK
jgi:predicted nucleotidyltransferase component of viral defense system